MTHDEGLNQLNPIEYWKLSNIANINARAANDARVMHAIDAQQSVHSVKGIQFETLRDHEEIASLIMGAVGFLRRQRLTFEGMALDLGSGTGIGAAIISKLPELSRIYAVEYAESFAKNIMPIVFSDFEAQTDKIVRVVGDFNHLELEDESMAMILEIDSLHHSEDLPVTLAECRRVLKPGGVILSIDRAWPDSTPRSELEAKLDVEYGEKQKEFFGIPAGQSYKRRDNGEHEYTIADWLKFYRDAGFDPYVFSQVHLPTFNRLLIRILPGVKLSWALASWLAKLGFRRLFIYGFNATRKVFIAVKKKQPK